MRVVVDREQVENNIAWYHEAVRVHGPVVRAHVKGHRLPEISRLQINHGAVGIVAQTAREALHHARAAEVPSVVLARPVTEPWRLKAYAEAADALRECGTTPIVQLCDREAVDALDAHARNTGARLAVRLEIEVGADRGFRSEAELLAAARQVQASQCLELEGVAGYYSPADAVEVEGWAHHSRLAARTLVASAEALRSAEIDCSTVSVGGTLNGLYAGAVPGVTEISAGAYALGDSVTAARSGCVPAITVHTEPDDGPQSARRAAEAFAETGNDWEPMVTATTTELRIVQPDAIASHSEARVLVPAHICPFVMQPLEYEVAERAVATAGRWSPALLPEQQS
jgi:D-serine deaminase-like pyridoxal phosphate-dependent protein